MVVEWFNYDKAMSWNFKQPEKKTILLKYFNKIGKAHQHTEKDIKLRVYKVPLLLWKNVHVNRKA